MHRLLMIHNDFKFPNPKKHDLAQKRLKIGLNKVKNKAIKAISQSKQSVLALGQQGAEWALEHKV